MTYAFHGLSDDIDLNWLAKQLHNPLIEIAKVADTRDPNPPGGRRGGGALGKTHPTHIPKNVMGGANRPPPPE